MNEKFEHKKSLGQHFLNSDHVPKQMCDAAGLVPRPGLGTYVGGSKAAARTNTVAETIPGNRSSFTEGGPVVLEIGPGTGVLTKEILDRGATVIAVEADARAISTLQESFADEIARGQLTVHHTDARELFPSEFGLQAGKYKVIANIPYYLSGSLFRQLLDTECHPSELVFLVQKEVAQRIARDTKESLLSLSVKVFGDPTYICTVKRGHFTPPPKVDSAIIAVRDINRQNFEEILPATPADFFQLLHLGFGQKRKQLQANLVNSGEWSREDVVAALRAATLPPDIRAEDIPLSTWLQLTRQLFRSRS